MKIINNITNLSIELKMAGISVTKTYPSAILTEECKERYDELNKCRSPRWRFFIMQKTEDETEIVVTYSEEASTPLLEAHENLLTHLPDQHPAWIAYNFPYKVITGGLRNKIAIINWCPDTLSRPTMKEAARIKMGSVTSSSLVKKTLEGAACFIQANAAEDLEFSVVLQRVSRFERDTIDYDASIPA